MENRTEPAAKNDRFLTLRQASSGKLTSYSPSGLCDPPLAARLAARLFGCYRANEANDPEAFLAAATATLSEYPEMIARRVAYGLPSRTKWLPSIAELRAACEDAIAPDREAERRARRRRESEAVLSGHCPAPGERARVAAIAAKLSLELAPYYDAPGETPEARLERLKADYRANPPRVDKALSGYLAGARARRRQRRGRERV